MSEEIQKSNNETLAIARQSYRASQESELAGVLFMIGQQYRTEITPEMSALWTSLLIVREKLSGPQIREAFMAYMAGPKCSYMPQPGELVALVPEVPKSDDTLKEMAELEKRKADGEKFYSLADVLKTAPVQPLKSMPKVKTVWPDIDPNKNAEMLRQQAERLRSGE